MKADPALDRGRQAFGARSWKDAYVQLTAAERAAPLGVEDLEFLAVSAQLTSHDEDSVEAWARAYRACMDLGDVRHAARCAFWLAFGLVNRGEMSRASGWLSRAGRALDGEQACAEQGYLLLPQAIGAFEDGDLPGALEVFAEATALGERFGEADLTTMARLGQGRALVRMGKASRGAALLDEAMVAVTDNEVSPHVVGEVYCSVIEACREIFDVRRAHEWTEALTRWCDAQPDLVPYRGQCLTYRAEVMQMHGRWDEALEQARRACELLASPSPHPELGAALYRLGEVLRLRGDVSDAEAAYQRASERGRSPQPGLALLRLAAGAASAAVHMLNVALLEVGDPPARAALLLPHLEVLLAVGENDLARAACRELSGLAEVFDSSLLRAQVAHGLGAVLLAEGDPRGALIPLVEARLAWQALDAPYDQARSRFLLGLAHRDLGDEEGARMELDAARRTFQELGARTDLAFLARKVGGQGPGVAGLTGREVEVLRLIAAGKTNKAIGDELFISEKTVARHVSNILTKLRLDNRAAATAHAFKHGLV